ncbi:MAG: phytanoyl-CoA dioxygenase family protein [Proteobacteria bacterium]|nr:phytanoyl-CoA dioxygenase family protein [Pseudomonadota bacterium]MDA1301805.1 phytanoyl-CoA dioxygenase family protein [Pseudomonadota bacterium]
MKREAPSETRQRALYRDGFVVLRSAVPREMVEAARRRLNQDMGRLRNRAAGARKLATIRQAATDLFRAGAEPVILDLFNKTPVKTTLEAFFGGPVNAATGAQIAANYPTDPSDRVNESGYRDQDTPFHGWVGHLDGLWNGATRPPEIGRPFTPHQRRQWYRDPSTNGVRREYPDYGTNITNFTALVGIALSDQRVEGVGNLGLLKGAHHRIGEFFRYQRAQGGPLGPDGPGWPREHLEAPNGHGLRHYPDAVRAAFKRGAATTEDGHCWPRPTLVKLAPGDAVIVHFNTPHSATRVDGPDPRLMVYFRTSPKRRPPGRAYAEGLCDIWKEWWGMRDYLHKVSQ